MDGAINTQCACTLCRASGAASYCWRVEELCDAIEDLLQLPGGASGVGTPNQSDDETTQAQRQR